MMLCSYPPSYAMRFTGHIRGVSVDSGLGEGLYLLSSGVFTPRYGVRVNWESFSPAKRKSGLLLTEKVFC